MGNWPVKELLAQSDECAKMMAIELSRDLEDPAGPFMGKIKSEAWLIERAYVNGAVTVSELMDELNVPTNINKASVARKLSASAASCIAS